jgi:hypothetical protein
MGELIIPNLKSASSSEKKEPIQNNNFLQIYINLGLHPRPHGRNIKRIMSSKYRDKFDNYILNNYHSLNLCQIEPLAISINYNTKTKMINPIILFGKSLGIFGNKTVTELSLKKHIENMILKCKDLMLYINLVIYEDDGNVGHANIILIYNNNIELYEPDFVQGHTPFGNSIALKFVENLAKSLNFNYISPNIICPLGLQAYEGNFSKIRKATSKEPGGYCRAFSYLWLALRLSYPSLSPTQLHNVVMGIGPENLTRLIEDFTFTMLYHSKVLPNKDSSSSKNKLKDVVDKMAIKDSTVSSDKSLIKKTHVKVSSEKPIIKRTRLKQSSSSLSPTVRHKHKKQEQ